MSDLVFVLHKPTGHAYPISAATVDPDIHRILTDEPATLAGGQPRPPVYNYPLTDPGPVEEAKPADEAPKPRTHSKPADTKEK